MNNKRKLSELLFTFMRIGLFTFGGGYAMISLIDSECVEKKKWPTHDELMNITIIAESTPGPIAINCATYVGYRQAGLSGATLATIGVVLPSFLVILLIVALLNDLLKNQIVQSVLAGIRPCFIGIVFATGIYMLINHCISLRSPLRLDLRGMGITLLLPALALGYPRRRKKDFSPILLIILSAVAGIVVYSL